MALEARAVAPAGLTVIIGEEVKTRDGDLICLFLDRAIPPGLSAGRDDRGGARAGRSRRDPASIRPDARVAPRATRRWRASRRWWTGSRPTMLVLVGHGNERRVRVRPRSRRCPGSRCRTPIRSWRSASPTPRSMATRRRRPACSAASLAREIVPGRASLLRSALDAGRQGHQSGPRQRPDPARDGRRPATAR